MKCIVGIRRVDLRTQWYESRIDTYDHKLSCTSFLIVFRVTCIIGILKKTLTNKNWLYHYLKG
jgi:hypothetical protein